MSELNRLKEVLAYDSESGVFTWLVSPGPKRSGSIAGSKDSHGSIKIRAYGKLYYAHRLAWLYMTEGWPPHEIDHINGNPGDNRWINLRAARHIQNSWNVKKHADNLTGLKGVTRRKRDPCKWFARLMKNGKPNQLGTFNCPAAAHFAYVVASELAFGEFARSA